MNGTNSDLDIKRFQDRRLDRELEDSFPASDPPTITRDPSAFRPSDKPLDQRQE